MEAISLHRAAERLFFGLGGEFSAAFFCVRAARFAGAGDEGFGPCY